MSGPESGDMGGFLSTSADNGNSPDDDDDVISVATKAIADVASTQKNTKAQLKSLLHAIEKQDDSIHTLSTIKDKLQEHVENPKQSRDRHYPDKRNVPSCQTMGSGNEVGCVHCAENIKLKQEIKKYQSDLNTKEATIKKLKDELNTNEATIKQLKDEGYSIRSESSRHERRIRSLIEDIERNKRQETDRQRQETDRQQQQHMKQQRLEQQIQEQMERHRQTEERLRQTNQRKVSVALHCASQQTLLDASAELSRMLTCHMEALGIEVRVGPCSDPLNHPITSPLIVLCINASRLGTDVQQAVQHVRCDQSVAVVVLHHKEYHALPSQPSEKILVGSQYRQLGAIVDIAFLKVKGMYTCDMNEKALERLTAFVSNFSHQG